jgi:glutamate/tyrosine decarboxylase-like PLP-dependent enzyme
MNWKHVDGIFTPGGSFANFMAITTSRYNLNPQTKRQGNSNHPLKILTSETSHYSMKKGANFCGIGEDNVIQIKTDSCGRMLV